MKKKNGLKFNRMKCTFSTLISVVMLCASLSGCANEPSEQTTQTQQSEQTQQTEDNIPREIVTEDFSIWIYVGIDSSYYASYKENPGIQYITSRTWGADDKGADIKIDLDFIVPIAGSETDNYNTLLATGDYPEIMQVVASAPVTELYEEGIALDITYYVENYMPNYLAFLEANPHLAKTAANIVDGEKKYIQLYEYKDQPEESWCGYSYRRDWIIKYGVNPIDGSAFSGSYIETNEDGSVNIDSWEDNVVFPSGGSDPVYISDWEWMLEIFARAIEDQNITDGYCMSLPYQGYHNTGDLVNAFGGGTTWNKTPEDEIQFGYTTDNFRVYLQCMNTWYANNWIDTAFPEHSSDLFFSVDEATVRQGKVGLWYGMVPLIEGRLDDGEGLLDGIVVFNARQPINDIYGAEDQQNKEPYMMFQASMESTAYVITDKAKDKNLEAFFTMMDYLYSPEGSMIKQFGLNVEQAEQIQSDIYTRYDITDGTFYEMDTDEGVKYAFIDKVKNEGGDLTNALRPQRIPGLNVTSLEVNPRPDSYVNNIKQWTWYIDTGRLSGSFTSQVTSEEAQLISKTQNNIMEYNAKNIPDFIKGVKDPYSDSDWQNYVDAINKYEPEVITKIYQDLLEQLE